MSDRTNDKTQNPELLAAFLDGKLDESARERMLARLAESADDLAVVADAAVALASTESTERVYAPVPGARLRPVPNRWVFVGLAAAVLVSVVGVWEFTSVGRSSHEKPVIVELASSIAPFSRPSSWSDDAWAVTRGPYDGGSEPVRAARIGALLVDVGVALSIADTSQAHLVAELARLLEAYPAGSAAAAAARNLRTTGNQQADMSPFTDVVSASLGLATPDALNTGAALEAARLAALTHDSQFFRNGAALNTLSAAARHDSTAAQTRDELLRLRHDAARGSVDWAGAINRFTDGLRSLIE